MKLRTLLALSLLASGVTNTVNASEEQQELSLAQEIKAVKTELEAIVSEKADSVELKVLSKEETEIQKHQGKIDKLIKAARTQKELITQTTTNQKNLDSLWETKQQKSKTLQQTLIDWKNNYKKSSDDEREQLNIAYNKALKEKEDTQAELHTTKMEFRTNKRILQTTRPGLEELLQKIEKAGTEANKYVDELNTSVIGYLTFGWVQTKQHPYPYNPEILKELKSESAK